MIDDKNEIEQQETDEFAVFMYGQVIDDSNNWDLMDSTELNKRVKAYNKDDSIENAVRLYSCLRFAETYFLVEKKGDGILVCQDESFSVLLRSRHSYFKSSIFNLGEKHFEY